MFRMFFKDVISISQGVSRGTAFVTPCTWSVALPRKVTTGFIQSRQMALGLESVSPGVELAFRSGWRLVRRVPIPGTLHAAGICEKTTEVVAVLGHEPGEQLGCRSYHASLPGLNLWGGQGRVMLWVCWLLV